MTTLSLIRPLARLRLLALAAWLVGVLLTLWMYRSLDAQQAERERFALEIEAKRAAEKFDAALRSRVQVLERMAVRWDVFGDLTRAQWEADAEIVARHLGAYQALEFISPEGQVRWVVPRAGNEAVLGRTTLDAPRRRALEAAARTGRPTTTDVVALAQGGDGVIVYVPATRGGALLGYVAAVFRVSDTLRTVLGEDSGARLALAVSDGGRTVYQDGAGVGGAAADTTFTLGSARWVVRVRPTPLMAREMASRLPELALAVGVGLASLLAAALYFALVARARSRVLSETGSLQRAILDGTHYAILSTDLDGRVRTWNAGAARLIGYSAEETVGQLELRALHDPEELAQVERELERQLGRPLRPGLEDLLGDVLQGGVQEREWTWIRRDGGRVPVQVSLTAIRDAQGAPTGVLAVAHDITGRRLTRQALVRAKEAAEEATRHKSDFLARMSHEIRTPMNGVLGMLELALQTPLDPEQRDYVETARASARSLLGLINDILDFSKVEAGQLVLERAPFALRDGLGEALKSLAARAHGKGLELLMHVGRDVPDALEGDLHRLRQVLVNLADNAIKFTEAGEVVVSVQLEAREAEAAVLRFVVDDTGIGVPGDKLERIFDAFVQAEESTTRRFGGTGLGLAICAQLVRLMGGRIWMERRPGGGTRAQFTVRLPLAAEGPPRPVPEELPDLSDLDVLVAVDSPTLRAILLELLEAWRMRPVAAANAPEALATLRAVPARFQVLVVDAPRALSAGLDLVRALRQDPALAHLPVVQLTTTQPGDALATPPRGPTHRLAKPVIPSLLLETLQDALGRAAPRAERRASTAAAAPARPLRVLLAEDNAVNRAVATRLLERAGHHVTPATHGREALEAHARATFDVLLMDVQMPELDGLEAARAIRAREAGTGVHVPILALTAQAMKGDAERCLAAGMDAYVAKPIEPATLFAALERLLAGAPAPAPAASAPPPPAALAPAIDPARLDDLVAGDAELLQDVVGLFYGALPQVRAELGAALEAGDPQALGRAAHRLKGSLLNLAAGPAADLARELEALGRTGTTEGGGALLVRLDAELARLPDALREAHPGLHVAA